MNQFTGTQNQAMFCNACQRTGKKVDAERATEAGFRASATRFPGRKRCHFHGGRSSGPKTAAGKARSARNALKHGHYSQAEKALRREANEVYRRALEAIEKLTLQLTIQPFIEDELSG